MPPHSPKHMAHTYTHSTRVPVVKHLLNANTLAQKLEGCQDEVLVCLL